MVAATAVPPLSGGPGSHGSEAAHALTLATAPPAICAAAVIPALGPASGSAGGRGASPAQTRVDRVLSSPQRLAGQHDHRAEWTAARPAVGRACAQPAVVGLGQGGLAVGDAGPADAAGEGLACSKAVVVTNPAELPFSQAAQDFCQ